MPRHAWGIDVGDGTLKAVRLRAESRGFAVVKAVEIPYTDPFLRKKAAPAALDRRALAALVQFGGSNPIQASDWVAVGFPSFHAFEGFLELPRVDEKKREELIRFEVASRYKEDADQLLIRYQDRRLKSTELEQVLAFGARAKEFETFMRCLHMARIPYDRVVPSASALVETGRLCVPPDEDYMILSPGFNATHLVLVRKESYWTRTLPLGLPGTPGQPIEIAQGKLEELCRILKVESQTFIRHTFGDSQFEPARVMISGEGSRAPSLINRLDAELPGRVEVLRPVGKVRVKTPPDDKDAMPEAAVYAMGKAIGLAAGMLDSPPRACLLAAAPPRRRALRNLASASILCGALLIFIAGLGVLEGLRAGRLGADEQHLAGLLPEHSVESMMALQGRIDSLKTDIERLNEVYDERDRFPQLGALLSRIEQKSPQGTYSDLHLVRLEMDFTGARSVRLVAGTRVGDRERVLAGLRDLFPSSPGEPEIEGPLPAEEESPPEGMAPLTLYRLKGNLP